jgi:hypothetical protein
MRIPDIYEPSMRLGMRKASQVLTSIPILKSNSIILKIARKKIDVAGSILLFLVRQVSFAEFGHIQEIFYMLFQDKNIIILLILNVTMDKQISTRSYVFVFITNERWRQHPPVIGHVFDQKISTERVQHCLAHINNFLLSIR